MKAVIYKSTPPVSGAAVPVLFKVEEVGTCYLFSGLVAEHTLESYVELYFVRNDTVFLIPDMLKELFLKWFGKAIGNDNTQQPTILSKKPYDDNDLGGPEQAKEVKEEMVKRGGKDISPSQITFVETIKERDMFEELQKLLDGITQDEQNEVDAIFVTLTTDAENPFLVQSMTKDPNREVDIKSYGGQIGRFEELRKKLDPKGTAGGLKEATFHFKKAVTSIARLGEKRPLYVFFVSTADHALADVAWVKQTYLPDIEKQLRNIKKID